MSSQAKNSGAHNLSSGLSYFKTQIEGALVQARNDLRDLDRRIMEIKQTDKSLSDLPKKIKHSIMVPFGSAAFFPGKLVHTNEVLVDVGCGILIECSASHAKGMMTRRLSKLEEERNCLMDTIQTLQKQVDDCNAQENEGIIDIVEDYDESVHGPYPIRGTDRLLKATNLPTVKEENVASLPEEDHVDSDEELFKMMDRMAELEAQSEAKGENRADEDSCSSKSAILKGSVKQQSNSHKPILKKGFLLQKKVHKTNTDKSPVTTSRDAQSTVRLEDRGVVERPTTSILEADPRHHEATKVESENSRGSVSKFKQRILSQRKK